MSGKIDWGKHNKKIRVEKQGTEPFYSGVSKILYGKTLKEDKPTKIASNHPAYNIEQIVADIVALKDVERLSVKNRQDLKLFFKVVEVSDRLKALEDLFECTEFDHAIQIDQDFRNAIIQNESQSAVFLKHKKGVTPA